MSERLYIGISKLLIPTVPLTVLLTAVSSFGIVYDAAAGTCTCHYESSTRVETKTECKPSYLQCFLTCGFQSHTYSPGPCDTTGPLIYMNIATGSLNSDRKADLFFHWTHTGDSKIDGMNRIFYVVDSGKFDKVENTINNKSVNEAPAHVLISDFNSDNRDDIYFHWWSSGRNRLYLNEGDGTKFKEVLNPVPTGSVDGAAFVVVGQFNEDKDADAYFYWPDGRNRLYTNQGKGQGFKEIINPIDIRSVDGANRVVLADFNGDGRADVYFHWNDGKNRLYVNEGNGSSFRETVNPISVKSVEGATFMTVGHFDADNRIDTYFQWPNGTNRLYLNQGNGASFKEVVNPINIKSIDGASRVVVADFNGDERADAYFLWNDGKNRLYVNEGNGTGFRENVDPIAADLVDLQQW